MIPTCHGYDDNKDDEGDHVEDKEKDKADLPHHGHGDDDDDNNDRECEKTTTTMNVRKLMLNADASTCQTIIREEAATAYTKYLHRKSDEMLSEGGR